MGFSIFIRALSAFFGRVSVSLSPLVILVFLVGPLAAQFQSISDLTLQTLQNPSSSHLEKLRALEVMGRTYEALNDERRQMSPGLYRVAYEALVLKDVDAALELAYTAKGLNGQMAADLVLGLDIIAPHLANPKAQALKAFLLERDIEVARGLIQVADTSRSKALGYMVLAEAYYAKNNISKAILFSTLSLAHAYSLASESQAKYYLTGEGNADISLRGTREEVLGRLNTVLEETYSPKTFRRYFSMATILGLLPSYPLVYAGEGRAEADPLHLCMAFDDRFAMHGGVTMLSTMLSADPESRYVFHVMEDSESPLNESYKELLCDMANEIDGERFEVSFEPVDKSVLPEDIRHIKKFRSWPRLVFFKLFIPETFAELDRILWLDADLIVTDDLTELYETPMGKTWFAGVRDYGGDKAHTYLPLDEGVPYLNVGVLLYNIAAINNAHGCKRVGDYCLQHPGFEKTLKYPEQDMLSIIFPDQILELEHQKPVHLEDGQLQFPRWNWFYMTDENTHWSRVHEHPASIIHMAGGGLKPWRSKFGPTWWSWFPKKNDGVQSVYWALRDMGPWTTRN